jgi:hypothetical protein
LKEFKKDYPPAGCYFFYGGSTPLYIDDISILPIDRALRNLERLLRPSWATGYAGHGGGLRYLNMFLLFLGAAFCLIRLRNTQILCKIFKI